MKILKCISAAALAVLLGVDAIAAEACRFVAKLKSGNEQTVVTYGTSLTAGGAWVGQMRAALEKALPGKVRVINSGKGSMWSKWGVDNLEQRVLANKPDAVFIEFAINDAFLQYATSVEQARANLENMIERIKTQNAECEVILMTMNPPIAEHLQRRPKITEYYQMYREVARERHLLLIDHAPGWEKILSQGETAYRDLVPDGIHPNAKGAEQVITPGILRAIGMASNP